MNTPRLDEKINDLEMLNSSDELNDKGKELLNEFKAIKKALNIQSVSKCSACGTKVYEVYCDVCVCKGLESYDQ